MKRIKRVFSNGDQVLHLWANQSQDSARSRNVFFKGKSCYSYGTHYELGRMVKYNGFVVALVNDTGWSVTTGKHIYQALSAASHLPTLKTKDLVVRSRHHVTENKSDKVLVREAMLRLQGDTLDKMFDVFKRRTFWKDDCWARQCESDYGLQSDISMFNKLCDTLGFETLRLDITPEYIKAYDAHVMIALKRTAELDKGRDERRAKQQEIDAAKLVKNVQAWRLGGPTTNGIQNLAHQLLRIVGETVETSKGAEVPLKHAIRLLRMIDKGTAKPGESVGSFELSEVRKDVVRIGCHTIDIDEARAVLGGVRAPLTLVKDGGQ
jgi:hypothetical protein